MNNLYLTEKAKTFHLYNVQLIFKNFSGKPSRYSPEGLRHFGVLVPEDVAEEMRQDGWKVKTFGDTGHVVIIWIPASWPQDMSHYDHETLGKVHVTVEGFRWVINDKTGVKPYLVELQIPVD